MEAVIVWNQFLVMDEGDGPIPVATRFAAARLLGFRVRTPPGDMDVSFECCVLSGRGLCVGPITRTEYGVSEYDLEASLMRSPWPTGGGGWGGECDDAPWDTLYISPNNWRQNSIKFSRAGSRVRMWKFSDVSGANSVLIFRVCWWFGSLVLPSHQPTPCRWGTESAPETSENLHVLTRLPARENF